MRVNLVSVLSAIRVGGLLVAALALWGFSWLAEEVLERETLNFDKSILLALHDWHSQLLDRLMTAITILGEPKLLLIVGLAWGVVLVALKRRAEAMTLAIAAAGAVGLNYWLKLLFARDRPLLWERVVDVSFNSFPSGHAMVSMVTYGMLGFLLANRFRRWRWAIAGGTLLLIAAIGLSRLYLGVHWPTDVAAGYTAGLVWLIACIFSLEVWRELRSTVGEGDEKSLDAD